MGVGGMGLSEFVDELHQLDIGEPDVFIDENGEEDFGVDGAILIEGP